MKGAGKKIWGYDSTNNIWLPIEVDENGYLKVDMSNINIADLADGDTVVLKALFDANTILAANIDNTPAALAIAASRIVGRLAAGNIKGCTISEVLNLLLTTQDDIIVRGAANPARLNIPASRIVGKAAAGNVTALTAAQVITLLGTNWVDKTIINQDFGATGGRLYNTIMTTYAERIIGMHSVTESPFSALINGAPNTTSVTYDNDTKETSLPHLGNLDGFGRLILHNTTRANSRKITSVNIITNVITTESSTDDWADNDVITMQSQTNASVGYFDIDISSEIGSTVTAILVFMYVKDGSATADAMRAIFLHPYETFNAAKRKWLEHVLAGQVQTIEFWQPVIDQTITVQLRVGVNIQYLRLACFGYVEPADT